MVCTKRAIHHATPPPRSPVAAAVSVREPGLTARSASAAAFRVRTSWSGGVGLAAVIANRVGGGGRRRAASEAEREAHALDRERFGELVELATTRTHTRATSGGRARRQSTPSQVGATARSYDRRFVLSSSVPVPPERQHGPTVAPATNEPRGRAARDCSAPPTCAGRASARRPHARCSRRSRRRSSWRSGWRGRATSCGRCTRRCPRSASTKSRRRCRRLRRSGRGPRRRACEISLAPWRSWVGAASRPRAPSPASPTG